MENRKKLIIALVLAIGLYFFYQYSGKKTTTPDTTTPDIPDGRTGGGGDDNPTTPVPVGNYVPTLIQSSLLEFIDIRWVSDGNGGYLGTDHCTTYPLASDHMFFYIVGNVVIYTGRERLTNYPWRSNVPVLVIKQHYKEPKFVNYSNIINRGYDISTPNINEVGAFQLFVFIKQV